MESYPCHEGSCDRHMSDMSRQNEKGRMNASWGGWGCRTKRQKVGSKNQRDLSEASDRQSGSSSSSSPSSSSPSPSCPSSSSPSPSSPSSSSPSSPSSSPSPPPSTSASPSPSPSPSSPSSSSPKRTSSIRLLQHAARISQSDSEKKAKTSSRQ